MRRAGSNNTASRLYLLLFTLPFLRGETPPLLRYPAIVTLTFALTLAAYEQLIGRTPPLRALFGMRLQQVPTASRALSQ